MVPLCHLLHNTDTIQQLSLHSLLLWTSRILGELFDRIVSRGQFSEPEAVIVMRQLLNVLDFMHQVACRSLAVPLKSTACTMFAECALVLLVLCPSRGLRLFDFLFERREGSFIVTSSLRTSCWRQMPHGKSKFQERSCAPFERSWVLVVPLGPVTYVASLLFEPAQQQSVQLSSVH